MNNYRSAEGIVEAEQFLPPLVIPKGVGDVYETNWGDGPEYTGAVWVGDIRTGVISGDWILYTNNGMSVCKPDDFTQKYSACSPLKDIDPTK